MQHVSFNPHVTVYPVHDYDRTPAWMYIALDRARFRRRRQETDLILSPVLSDVHRMYIRISRLDMSDIYYHPNSRCVAVVCLSVCVLVFS